MSIGPAERILILCMGKTYGVFLLIETSREYGRGLLRGIYRYSSLHRQWQIERRRLDTDDSISEIADLLGFPTADHIASCFRSVRGINPLTLRRQGTHGRS